MDWNQLGEGLDLDKVGNRLVERLDRLGEQLSINQRAQHAQAERLAILEELSSAIKPIHQLWQRETPISGRHPEVHHFVRQIVRSLRHGLKPKVSPLLLLRQDAAVTASFWDLVSAYTFKDNVALIDSLCSQDPSQDRAALWVTVALNESSLLSYFEAIQQDQKRRRTFYEPWALMMNEEQSDMVKMLLVGLTQYRFQIALESSSRLLAATITTPESRSRSVSTSGPIIDMHSAAIIESHAALPDEPSSTPPQQQHLPPAPAAVEDDSDLTPAQFIAAAAAGRQASKQGAGRRKTKKKVAAIGSDNADAAAAAATRPEEAFIPPPPVVATPQADVALVAAPALPAQITVAPVEAAPITITAAAVHGAAVPESDGPKEEHKAPVTVARPQAPIATADKQASSPISTSSGPTTPRVQGSDRTSSHASSFEDLLVSRSAGTVSSEPILVDSESPTSIATEQQQPEEVDKDGKKHEEQFGGLFKRYVQTAPGTAVVLADATTASDSGAPALQRAGSVGSALSVNLDADLADALQESDEGPLSRPSLEGSGGSPEDDPDGLVITDEYVMLEDALTDDSAFRSSSAHSADVLTQIASEKGLDSQQYKCAQCSKQIGIPPWGEARVCAYNGKYYCTDCHGNDMAIIPARVLHNWDFFAKYKVCKVSAAHLNATRTMAIFDIAQINPLLYNFVEELRELRDIRQELNVTRDYIQSCGRISAKEKAALTKLSWSREYLVDRDDVLSLRDLVDLQRGTLLPLVKKIAAAYRSHILTKCTVCKARGAFCRGCNSKQIIYPFMFQQTVRCPKCNNLFHRNCFNPTACIMCALKAGGSA